MCWLIALFVMKDKNNIQFYLFAASMSLGKAISEHSSCLSFTSIAAKVEIIERTNGCAMINQMKSVFSQSPIYAR